MGNHPEARQGYVECTHKCMITGLNKSELFDEPQVTTVSLLIDMKISTGTFNGQNHNYVSLCEWYRSMIVNVHFWTFVFVNVIICLFMG